MNLGRRIQISGPCEMHSRDYHSTTNTCVSLFSIHLDPRVHRILKNVLCNRLIGWSWEPMSMQLGSSYSSRWCLRLFWLNLVTSVRVWRKKSDKPVLSNTDCFIGQVCRDGLLPLLPHQCDRTGEKKQPNPHILKNTTKYLKKGFSVRLTFQMFFSGPPCVLLPCICLHGLGSNGPKIKVWDCGWYFPLKLLWYPASVKW